MTVTRVRVFLLTFRRNNLLPRALDSLLAQTFKNWTCEVHNGDPSDPFPGDLVRRIDDPRVRLVLPPERTGPVEAFNQAHVPAPEEFQSILEDDNTWAPTFLETMVNTLDAYPAIDLAWCNQRISEEQPDGSWRDTGRCVWEPATDGVVRTFAWPQLIQFNDFLHANGAMLLRSRAAARLVMPADSPSDMIEHTRERMMNFPILLVLAPLATFSVTLRTFRSNDYLGWGRTQALLGAAFLRHVPFEPAAAEALWNHRRSLRPRATNALISAGLVARDFKFLSHATPGDWFAFLKGCVRRPHVTWRILRAKTDLAAAWKFLSDQTAARTAEARARGFTAVTAHSLIDKRNWETGASAG